MRSTIYPNLWVHDLDVRFRDGVAEVKDKKSLDALAGIEGVEVPKVTPPAKKSDPATE